MPPARDDPAAHDDTPLSRDSDRSPGVLLVDIEPALTGLLQEWLASDGLQVREAGVAHAHEPVALILIDLPYPRRDGTRRLQQLARAWPGVPVVVLSATVFAGVAAHGEVARQLGAAAVLATPVARATLRATVRALLGARP